MRRSYGAVAVLVAAGLLGSAGLVRAADDKAATGDAKPKMKAEKAAPAKKSVRLTKPWSGLSSLSDDQKAQIAVIHRKALDEIKAVEKREKEEIMAVLDDAQKSELAAMTEKDTAERKMRSSSTTTKKPTDAEAKPAAGEKSGG